MWAQRPNPVSASITPYRILMSTLPKPNGSWTGSLSLLGEASPCTPYGYPMDERQSKQRVALIWIRICIHRQMKVPKSAVYSIRKLNICHSQHAWGTNTLLWYILKSVLTARCPSSAESANCINHEDLDSLLSTSCQALCYRQVSQLFLIFDFFQLSEVI